MGILGLFGKESYKAECARCHESITIAREEVEAGRYTCPTCNCVNPIPNLVRAEFTKKRAHEDLKRQENERGRQEKERTHEEREKRRAQQKSERESAGREREDMRRRQEAARALEQEHEEPRRAVTVRPPTSQGQRSKHVLGGALLVLVAIGASVLLWHHYQNWQLSSEIGRCASAGVFDVSVSYGSYFSKDEVVFDVRKGNPGARKIDAVHLLFQFGHAIDGIPYGQIVLAAGGRRAFQIHHAAMTELSKEYTYGNPLYSIRKWPSILCGLDGSQAFGEWTGGIIGVLGKEMEDVDKALDQWLYGL